LDIRALRLDQNLIELETQGYTVLKDVLSADKLARAKAAIVARAEKLTGKTIDVASARAEDFAGMQYLPYMLYDDPVFEDILMEPRPLALVTFLLGESCLLSSMGCHFRGPGGAPLMLHSDNGNGTPVPFSTISYVANVNYALTPYSREAGALVMVPGSHKLLRQPTPAENFRPDGMKTAEALARARAGEVNDATWKDPPNAVSMDLAPGDAVVWHGNTWHGSFKRTLPGVRINLAAYFCRQFVQTQEYHRTKARDAALKRHDNDERFKILLGAKQPYGWQHEGPDYSLMNRNPRGLYD
jgi:ectoine hydroxylase-related dioxygenase (phytanoyl-CoA dioxygenase family)